jgi:cation diffusion facilitator family transporter
VGPGHDPVVTLTDPARDRRLLLLSVWASAGFAVLSTVWGLLSGSSMIVFDGLYSFASVGLSTLSVFALRFTARGADERFPWGREVVEPMVVVVKATTLGALCVYAAVGGVMDLTSGGRPVAAGWALAYAALATAGGLAVTVVLRRAARTGRASELVRAEAAEWLGDSLLSVGVLAGFGIALGLTAAGRDDLAAYVDPAMVVLVSLAFLWIPVRLVAGGMREMLSMSPPAALLDRIHAEVEGVEGRFGFRESWVRSSKVGGRMDIEIDFLLDEPDSRVRTVADCDAVRQEVHDRLATLGYERSVVVAFTGDRRWAG